MVLGHQLVLGTMRLHEKGVGADEWAALFAVAWDRGVRFLHSSSEYDSMDLLRSTLDRLKARRPDIAFAHVVKLAEPSFQETGFDPDRLRERLCNYCDLLSVEQIDTVQWMWRATLDDDAVRIRDFEANKTAILAAKEQVRADGLMREFGCFPYTPAFADAAIQSGLFDGLIVYANAFEREYDPAMARARGKGMFVDIIRPFAAGRALRETDQTSADVLSALLQRTGARRVILSVSSQGQLDAVLPPA